MHIFKNLDEVGEVPAQTLCLFYYADTILVMKHGDGFSFPRYEDLKFTPQVGATFFMQGRDGASVLVADLLSDNIPDGFLLENARNSYHHFNSHDRDLIAKTFGYVHWCRNHKFCGRCAQETMLDLDECAWVCPACHYAYYPKVNPSMIVLVYRGREMLLARSPHFMPGVYSTLAGYVAPGETLEQTVMREVKEEVNIDVKNIRYIASQSWPFPNVLMLGFYAEYAGGELMIDGKEIEAAGWFTADNLPPLPREISIAWQLIHGFILEGKKQ